MIELALEWALKAHKGQKDKGGKPYITHPLRLMAGMPDDTTRAVALLHDVLEDSNITAANLETAGFPTAVVSAVVCLTRGDNETYEAFIDRIALNPIARQVKMADIEDNLNILRLPALTDTDLKRAQKYHRAWQRLATCAPQEAHVS